MIRRQYIPDHIRTAGDTTLNEYEQTLLQQMASAIKTAFVDAAAYKEAIFCKQQLALIASERHYRYRKRQVRR